MTQMIKFAKLDTDDVVADLLGLQKNPKDKRSDLPYKHVGIV